MFDALGSFATLIQSLLACNHAHRMIERQAIFIHLQFEFKCLTTLILKDLTMYSSKIQVQMLDYLKYLTLECNGMYILHGLRQCF